MQDLLGGQAHPIQEGRWIDHVCQELTEPNRKKVNGYMHNGTNTHNGTSIPKQKITAADDDAFYATLEEIFLTQHECVIMVDFNQPHIDWSLQQLTPAPGSKLL